MSAELENPADAVCSILVVEDDAALRVLLIRTLRENGYQAVGAGSGAEMWRAMDDAKFDLILLDVMLPGTSGLDLCRTLRKDSDVPVIMLSARGEEMDRVLGLELGADDYIPKPYGAKELLARIRAILRRGASLPAAERKEREQIRFSGWTLDLRRRELTSPEGAGVDLSGAEFDLLAAFLNNPQRVIGRERLLELSRARLADSSDRSIDVLVSRLRRKLAQAGEAESLIRTVRGVGYILTAPVER
jgi:two-component system, OmpR family, response regulator